MPNRYRSTPVLVAGLLACCFTAAAYADTANPGTANANNTNRPGSATIQSPASPAARADATRSSAATTLPSTGGSSAIAMNGAKGVSSSDKTFMKMAAEGGMAEVQLSKLATQKAKSDQVRQFGQRMVDDHSKADDKLKSIASDKGFTLPSELDKSAQRERDKLSKLSGADFDREYMNHMVSDHRKAVSAFRAESRNGKDSDLKEFSSSTLPTLQEHLQLAQAAQKTANGEPGGAKTSSRLTVNKTGS